MMDELISDISRGKASLSVHVKETVPEIMSNGSLVRIMLICLSMAKL